jgi:hypothetical protein
MHKVKKNKGSSKLLHVAPKRGMKMTFPSKWVFFTIRLETSYNILLFVKDVPHLKYVY